MTLPLRLLVLLGCVLISTSAFAQAPAEVATLRNYDITKPITTVRAPDVQGDYAYTGFGERFTLAGESGYLDSIRIHFDSVWGDLIQIGVFRDDLRETARGTFHLADYSFFGLIARYELDISGMQDLKNFWVTIPTEHLPMPKEFHIGVGANPLVQGSDEYTSGFTLIGEVHYNQVPTIDSRSEILITQDFVNFTTDIFDGFFTFGGLPLGINFHLEAVVDQEPASVARDQSSGFTVYPNPVAAGGQVKLSGADDVTSVTLYDVLGKKQAHWQRAEHGISLPALPAGVYSLVVKSASGSRMQRIVVR